MTEFIWGSGDAGFNGLWEGDKMLASTRQLERDGYSLDYILGMNQQQLDRLVQKIKRDIALPASVDNTLSIEDFLE